MAYSESLADRIRDALADREVEERKMFGGLAFMLAGNMVCGVMGEDLCARMGPEAERHIGEPHVTEMDFTGRPMRNFAMVEAAGIADDAALDLWVGRCLAHAESLPAK